MEVIEGYIYPTSISDYVDIHGQMSVKITSIECPNGTIWHGEDEYNRLEMFETYEAAEEPYIVTFKETYTNDTNILLVYCYTKEQAVEKGIIESTIPFTFKEFIVDGQMYIVAGKRYSSEISDYVVAENLDTIEITSIYNLFYQQEAVDLNISSFEKYKKKVFLPVGEPPEGESSPFTWFKLTFTDTSCNYSQDLYISVYSSEADTSGAIIAPTEK